MSKVAPPYPAPRHGAVLPLFSVLVLFAAAPAWAAEPAPLPAVDPVDTLEYWLGPGVSTRQPMVWRVSTGVEFSRFDLGGGLEAKGWQNFYAASLKRGGWTFGAVGAHQTYTVPTAFGAQTLSGLSDTTLLARYDLDRMIPAGDWMVAAAARIKLPTASAARGLGTGKVDETVSLEAMRLYGRWAVFGYGGYARRGGAAAGRDTWNGAAGADFRASPRWNLGLSYEWRQRAFSAPASNLYGYARYWLTDTLSLSTYSSAGLARKRPDLSVGMQVVWFGLW